ncbi:MAG TPA: multidrug efflux RND transporter permease subunit [Gemmatimonadales bacterium]|nr:multidrug efflux RND transporter permease subunit [Gemmatimonadales bacterium]
MSAAPEIRNLFIRRPIFSAVISIAIVLLGAFSLTTLPVNRYPPLTPPAVQVQAVYPGATAQDVADAVAAPIEQQLSGLQGLLYFRSSNSSDGTMNLSVYFDISRDQDLAAVDVQNQIALAEPQLPQEVVRNGITVKKAQTDILLVGALVSDDPRYDAEYLSNYAKIYVEDELKRITGVGDAVTFGQLEFSMRLSLDPDRMAQLGLTVGDVAAAVREQNATNPAGLIGGAPSPSGTQLTVPVITSGRLKDATDFDQIIVRGLPDGSLVRIADIGHAQLGARNYNLGGRLDGGPTAFFLVYLRPGANALDVKRAVLTRLADLSKSFPRGVRWIIPFDTTPFITASITEVVKTLFAALLLVTLVVFIFLQNWRATLIPVLAVPVSVIGAFFGMRILGFTVNLLTLFGLVLAIGIVVDDAIVVIENVERIMAGEHVPPAVAADRAMRQVSGALIAIVLVLCAVFVPVAFLGGITGLMYRQFAITIAVAVVLSGIVALTLTPALCAVLLKPVPESGAPAAGSGRGLARLFAGFNRGFQAVTERYLGAAGRVIDRPRTFFACFGVIVALLLVLVRTVPSAFIPTEDKGYFAIFVELPDAASRQRTDGVVRDIQAFLTRQPAVRHSVALVGLNIIQNANQTNAATIFVGLKPWDERTAKQDQLDAVVGAVNGYLFRLREARAFAFNLPEIPGLGTTAGLEMNLQDRGVTDIQQFAALAGKFARDANARPELRNVTPNIRVSVPQLFVQVDREKVKALGVSLTDLFQTLQAFLSTLYINDFNLYGKTYRVQVEAQARFRQTPDDIGRLHVRGPNQQMIPVSALTQTEFRAGPSILTRFNGFASALITGSPGPGKSSGQMLDAAEDLARDSYGPQGVGYAFSGQSYQERVSSGQGGFVFGLGLIMVFLVLAAQYESWSIPFAVLLGVPFGVLGALLGVWVRGMPNDVYVQIGLIVVVGLAAKNAILIVAFATELRAQGRTIREAAIEAGRERLRPILMTSFAFILGVAPLLVSSGAGAASRHSIGTSVFFGMLVATTVGVFFIPLFFAVIRALSERAPLPGRAGRPAQVQPAPSPAPSPAPGD